MLAAQFAPHRHLGLQAGGDALQAIAAHAKVVDHGPIGQVHPMAFEAFAPAALVRVAPTEGTAIPQDDQFPGNGKGHGKGDWKGGLR